MPQKIVKYIEEWTGEAVSAEEVERLKPLHPICKLEALVDAMERGITRKEDIIRELETKCAGKLHGIHKISKRAEELIARKR